MASGESSGLPSTACLAWACGNPISTSHAIKSARLLSLGMAIARWRVDAGRSRDDGGGDDDGQAGGLPNEGARAGVAASAGVAAAVGVAAAAGVAADGVVGSADAGALASYSSHPHQ